MKRFFAVIFCTLTLSSVSAQNTADIGLWGGIGSYIGDVTNIDKASSLNPNVGLFFRYNFNSRVSLRTSAMLGTIGATGEFETQPWEFDKFMTDISLMGEFNFFRYIIGSKRYSSTPYLLGGVGASLYNYTYDPNRLSPVVYYLNPGQLAGVPANVRGELLTGQDEAVVALNIPVGFGFKFNVGGRLSVGIEAILRKYFNDKIDDLDDPRKYYSTTTNLAGETTEGWVNYNDFLHNNDFTLHLGLHLTYRFYRGRNECPVYENIN
ncbi:DUF6089 family protein [Sunxiuqinia indica]|uniref:DUF6089 family protein n=1 Tax=Sunxiuqinia indica TaxID=2692584 RepID=UPI0013587095|nr:DUF6089 family protein [Sunxiuqinia indica]